MDAGGGGDFGFGFNSGDSGAPGPPAAKRARLSDGTSASSSPQSQQATGLADYTSFVPTSYTHLTPAMLATMVANGTATPLQPPPMQLVTRQRQYAATLAQQQQQQQVQQMQQLHIEQLRQQQQAAVMAVIKQQNAGSSHAALGIPPQVQLQRPQQAQLQFQAQTQMQQEMQQHHQPAAAVVVSNLQQPLGRATDDPCAICRAKGDGVYTCRGGCGLHVHPTCIGEKLLFPHSGWCCGGRLAV